MSFERAGYSENLFLNLGLYPVNASNIELCRVT